jgi:hypothetical protein
MIKYKDMLNRDLKIGQTCVNLYFPDEKVSQEQNQYVPYGKNFYTSVFFEHRMVKIKRLNPKSVRVQYISKDNKIKETNVYKPNNRLIIMDNMNLSLIPFDLEERPVYDRSEILDI